MEEVLREIRVPVGEGAPHIVPGSPPGLHQLLEPGNNAVIAAVSGVVHPEGVVNLLPPVQGEDHIVHLPVGEVDDVLVNQHPVGGEGEAEVLAAGLLPGPGVGHQVLHHLPVHQRLAAEEIHLQVGPIPRVGDEEVQGLLPHLEAHQSPVAVVFPLACEAVGAVEVAAVGHVEAQGLHHVAGTLLEGPGDVREGVRRVELPGPHQGLHVGDALPELRLRHVGAVPVGFQQSLDNLLRRMVRVEGNQVIGHLVHHMDAAGAAVQDEVVAVQLVLMYHVFLPSRPEGRRSC